MALSEPSMVSSAEDAAEKYYGDAIRENACNSDEGINMVTQFSTVYISDGFYVCYPSSDKDSTLAHVLKDPRAHLVDKTEKLTFDRVLNPFDLCPPGAYAEFIIMAHLWKEKIDFVYFDVGANNGVTSAAVAAFMQKCGRSNEIYSFEPGDAYAALCDTLRVNRIDSWCHRFNIAISDTTGELVFHQIVGNSSAGSLLPEISSRASGQEMSEHVVKSITIDDFVKKNKISKNIVCKIDTEGNDLKVIRGLAKTLKNRIVTLYFEFTPSLVRAYADPVAELTNLQRDYVLIDANRRGSIISNASEYVSSIDVYTDVIALPRKTPNLPELIASIARGF